MRVVPMRMHARAGNHIMHLLCACTCACVRVHFVSPQNLNKKEKKIKCSCNCVDNDELLFIYLMTIEILSRKGHFGKIK